ncbi:Uncharacterised protein [BD1-7 clade bacterium]|uniref:SGNH hydrolase-type esterase domain-containing protein n=1 Tax=BD1-7 clade bacterium TaxID=2029982 RepID=A0A5S9PEJ3_9GAMM|nr:Uncharacterised protein [BD1-7 clade bacterium]CAA0102013.1 Uncharacterised protein [BD1-7 clade bacterium]
MPPLPLRYWAWIVGIIVLGVAYLETHELDIIFGSPDQEYGLSSPVWQPDQGNRVILIGNSLLGLAAPGVEAIENSLLAQNIDASVVKIIKRGLRPNYFLPLLPILANAKPNLVVIQIENFYFARGYEFLKTFRHNLHQSRQNLTATFASTQPQPHWDTTRECQKKDSTDTAKMEENYERLHIIQPTAFEPYLSFIQTVIAQGGKVVLLEAGRSPQAEAHLGPEKRAMINRISEQLSRQSGADFWQFPQGLTVQNDYCDSAHMTPSGRAIFMEWLAPLMAAELNPS